MVNFPYDCPIQDCPEAYPHELLVDKHLVDDHPQHVDPDNRDTRLTMQ